MGSRLPDSDEGLNSARDHVRLGFANTSAELGGTAREFCSCSCLSGSSFESLLQTAQRRATCVVFQHVTYGKQVLL